MGPPAFSVGQLVYPIVGGAWQTASPVRITDVARHTDGELYYAVEGATTRYPAAQLEPVDLIDPLDDDPDGAELDPETAWPALEELLTAAEEAGADWLASPWREARKAGEDAVYGRSTTGLERACEELRALIAGGGATP